MSVKLPSEAAVLRGVLELLTLRKVFHFRVANAGVRRVDRKTGRVFTAFHGTRGVPDVLALLPRAAGLKAGTLVGIEMKSRRGKLSADQEAFRDRLEQAGALYLVVRDVEELDRALKGLGVG